MSGPTHLPIGDVVNGDELDDLMKEVMIGFEMSPTDSMASSPFSEGFLSAVRDSTRMFFYLGRRQE
jgi:hypothetical protein